MHTDKYTCAYAQAEDHTYTHTYAYMALATVSNMSSWCISLSAAEKFAVVSIFYDNQHASCCIKAESNAGQSRVGLCKQVLQKNFA